MEDLELLSEQQVWELRRLYLPQIGHAARGRAVSHELCLEALAAHLQRSAHRGDTAVAAQLPALIPDLVQTLRAVGDSLGADLARLLAETLLGLVESPEPVLAALALSAVSQRRVTRVILGKLTQSLRLRWIGSLTALGACDPLGDKRVLGLCALQATAEWLREDQRLSAMQRDLLLCVLLRPLTQRLAALNLPPPDEREGHSGGESAALANNERMLLLDILRALASAARSPESQTLSATQPASLVKPHGGLDSDVAAAFDLAGAVVAQSIAGSKLDAAVESQFVQAFAGELALASCAVSSTLRSVATAEGGFPQTPLDDQARARLAAAAQRQFATHKAQELQQILMQPHILPVEDSASALGQPLPNGLAAAKEPAPASAAPVAKPRKSLMRPPGLLRAPSLLPELVKQLILAARLRQILRLPGTVAWLSAVRSSGSRTHVFSSMTGSSSGIAGVQALQFALPLPPSVTLCVSLPSTHFPGVPPGCTSVPTVAGVSAAVLSADEARINQAAGVPAHMRASTLGICAQLPRGASFTSAPGAQGRSPGARSSMSSLLEHTTRGFVKDSPWSLEVGVREEWMAWEDGRTPLSVLDKSEFVRDATDSRLWLSSRPLPALLPSAVGKEIVKRLLAVGGAAPLSSVTAPWVAVQDAVAHRERALGAVYDERNRSADVQRTLCDAALTAATTVSEHVSDLHVAALLLHFASHMSSRGQAKTLASEIATVAKRVESLDSLALCGAEGEKAVAEAEAALLSEEAAEDELPQQASQAPKGMLDSWRTQHAAAAAAAAAGLRLVTEAKEEQQQHARIEDGAKANVLASTAELSGEGFSACCNALSSLSQLRRLTIADSAPGCLAAADASIFPLHSDVQKQARLVFDSLLDAELGTPSVNTSSDLGPSSNEAATNQVASSLVANMRLLVSVAEKRGEWPSFLEFDNSEEGASWRDIVLQGLRSALGLVRHLRQTSSQSQGLCAARAAEVSKRIGETAMLAEPVRPLSRQLVAHWRAGRFHAALALLNLIRRALPPDSALVELLDSFAREAHRFADCLEPAPRSSLADALRAIDAWELRLTQQLSSSSLTAIAARLRSLRSDLCALWTAVSRTPAQATEAGALLSRIASTASLIVLLADAARSSESAPVDAEHSILSQLIKCARDLVATGAQHCSAKGNEERAACSSQDLLLGAQFTALRVRQTLEPRNPRCSAALLAAEKVETAVSLCAGETRETRGTRTSAMLLCDAAAELGDALEQLRAGLSGSSALAELSRSSICRRESDEKATKSSDEHGTAGLIVSAATQWIRDGLQSSWAVFELALPAALEAQLWGALDAPLMHTPVEHALSRVAEVGRSLRPSAGDPLHAYRDATALLCVALREGCVQCEGDAKADYGSAVRKHVHSRVVRVVTDLQNVLVAETLPQHGSGSSLVAQARSLLVEELKQLVSTAPGAPRAPGFTPEGRVEALVERVIASGAKSSVDLAALAAAVAESAERREITPRLYPGAREDAASVHRRMLFLAESLTLVVEGTASLSPQPERIVQLLWCRAALSGDDDAAAALRQRAPWLGSPFIPLLAMTRLKALEVVLCDSPGQESAQRALADLVEARAVGAPMRTVQAATVRLVEAIESCAAAAMRVSARNVTSVSQQLERSHSQVIAARQALRSAARESPTAWPPCPLMLRGAVLTIEVHTGGREYPAIIFEAEVVRVSTTVLDAPMSVLSHGERKLSLAAALAEDPAALAAAMRPGREFRALLSSELDNELTFELTIVVRRHVDPLAALTVLRQGGLATVDLSQQSRPGVPAVAVGSNGEQLFYPPVNIPPPVASLSASGAPLFLLPSAASAPRPLPMGISPQGLPFFCPAKRLEKAGSGISAHTELNAGRIVRSLCTVGESPAPEMPRIAGYTPRGVAFTLLPGAELPPPSGFTAFGMPFYSALDLVRFSMGRGGLRRASTLSATTSILGEIEAAASGRGESSTQAASSEASGLTSGQTVQRRRSVLERRRSSVAAANTPDESADFSRQVAAASLCAVKPNKRRIRFSQLVEHQSLTLECRGFAGSRLLLTIEPAGLFEIVQPIGPHVVDKDGEVEVMIRVKHSASLPPSSILLATLTARATNAITTSQPLAACALAVMSSPVLHVERLRGARGASANESGQLCCAVMEEASATFSVRNLVAADDAGLIVRCALLNQTWQPSDASTRGHRGAEVGEVFGFFIDDTFLHVPAGSDRSVRVTFAPRLEGSFEAQLVLRVEWSDDERSSAPDGTSGASGAVALASKALSAAQAVVEYAASAPLHVAVIQVPLRGLGGMPVSFKIGSRASRAADADGGGASSSHAGASQLSRALTSAPSLSAAASTSSIESLAPQPRPTDPRPGQRTPRSLHPPGLPRVLSSPAPTIASSPPPEQKGVIILAAGDAFDEQLPDAETGLVLGGQTRNAGEPGARAPSAASDKINGATHTRSASSTSERGAQLGVQQHQPQQQPAHDSVASASAEGRANFFSNHYEHVVDFGVVQSDQAVSRLVAMTNLLSDPITLVVHMNSEDFVCEADTVTVEPGQRLALLVTLPARARGDGVLTGELDVFWQDFSTVFHLVAFVGQPIVIDSAPAAFAPPVNVGRGGDGWSRAVFHAVNRSPYRVVWTLQDLPEPFAVESDRPALISAPFSETALVVRFAPQRCGVFAANVHISTSSPQRLSFSARAGGRLTIFGFAVARGSSAPHIDLVEEWISEQRTAFAEVIPEAFQPALSARLGFDADSGQSSSATASTCAAASDTPALSLFAAPGGASPKAEVAFACSAELKGPYVVLCSPHLRTSLKSGALNGSAGDGKQQVVRVEVALDTSELREDDAERLGFVTLIHLYEGHVATAAVSARCAPELQLIAATHARLSPSSTSLPSSGAAVASVTLAGAALHSDSSAKLSRSQSGLAFPERHLSTAGGGGEGEAKIKGVHSARTVCRSWVIVRNLVAERRFWALELSAREAQERDRAGKSLHPPRGLLRSLSSAPPELARVSSTASGGTGASGVPEAFLLPHPGGSLAPNGVQVVPVDFAPRAQGKFHDTLQLCAKERALDAGTRACEISLFGAARISALVGIPESLHFGFVEPGQVSVRWLEVRNGGSAPEKLRIHSDSPQFLCFPRRASLAPDAVTRVAIVFRCQRSGPAPDFAVLGEVMVLASRRQYRVLCRSVCGPLSLALRTASSEEAELGASPLRRGVQLGECRRGTVRERDVFVANFGTLPAVLYSPRLSVESGSSRATADLVAFEVLGSVPLASLPTQRDSTAGFRDRTHDALWRRLKIGLTDVVRRLQAEAASENAKKLEEVMPDSNSIAAGEPRDSQRDRRRLFKEGDVSMMAVPPGSALHLRLRVSCAFQGPLRVNAHFEFATPALADALGPLLQVPIGMDSVLVSTCWPLSEIDADRTYAPQWAAVLGNGVGAEKLDGDVLYAMVQSLARNRGGRARNGLELDIGGRVVGHITVAPRELDFGAQPAQSTLLRLTAAEESVMGSQSEERVVVVTNASLEPQLVQVSSIDPPCFIVGAREPGASASSVARNEWIIGPGRSLKLAVRFLPAESDTVYIGRALLRYGAAAVAVPLRGVGATARLEFLDASPFVVPPLCVHETARVTVRVRNSGLLASRFVLRCSSPAFGLLDREGTEVGQLHGVIASGETFAFSVLCVPARAKGEYLEALLSLRWQLAPGARGVWSDGKLTLSARVGVPQLEVVDAHLVEFGTVFLNRAARRSIRFRNNGTAPLRWSVRLHPQGVLSVSPECGVLSPDHAQTLGVLFSPTQLVHLDERFELRSDGGSASFHCHGLVGVPQMTIRGNLEHDFGRVAVGQPLEHRITLINAGNVDMRFRVMLDDAGRDFVEQKTAVKATEELDAVGMEKCDPAQRSADARQAPPILWSDADVFHDHLLSSASVESGFGLLASSSAPQQLGPFTVWPWCGVLAARAQVSIAVAVHPREIGVRSRAFVTVSYAPRLTPLPPVPDAFSTKQEAILVSPAYFAALDTHGGLLSCVGTGICVEIQSQPAASLVQSWREDLALALDLERRDEVEIPLGLIGVDHEVSISPQIVVKNTGNAPAALKISAMEGNSAPSVSASSIRIEPSVLALEPGEALSSPVTFVCRAQKPGFLERRFVVSSSAECLGPAFCRVLRVMALCGEPKLVLGASRLDFGVRAVDKTHSLVLPVKNDSNVFITCRIAIRRRADAGHKQRRVPRLRGGEAVEQSGSAPLLEPVHESESEEEVVASGESERSGGGEPEGRPEGRCPFRVVQEVRRLAPGQEAAVEVQYLPTLSEDLEASLGECNEYEIGVEWLGPMLSVPLSATPGVKLFSLEERAIHLGACAVNTKSAQHVTIVNRGTLPVEFTMALEGEKTLIELGEADALQRVHLLPPKSSRSVAFSVSCLREGAFTTCLVFRSELGEQAVSVLGTGCIANIALSHEKLDLGEVASQQTHLQLVAVRNPSRLNLAVQVRLAGTVSFVASEPTERPSFTGVLRMVPKGLTGDQRRTATMTIRRETARRSHGKEHQQNALQQPLDRPSDSEQVLVLDCPALTTQTLELHLMSPLACEVSATLTALPSVVGAASCTCSILANVSEMQLRLDDVSAARFGKVILQQRKVLTRHIVNATKRTTFDLSLELEELPEEADSKRAVTSGQAAGAASAVGDQPRERQPAPAVWFVEPALGERRMLAPGERMALKITYFSQDAREGTVRRAQLRVRNHTLQKDDAILDLSGSVAFPRLRLAALSQSSDRPPASRLPEGETEQGHASSVPPSEVVSPQRRSRDAVRTEALPASNVIAAAVQPATEEAQLDFGICALPEEQWRSVPVSNDGTGEIEFSCVIQPPIGDAESPFALDTGSSIVVAEECKTAHIRVAFRPRRAGLFVGTLSINSLVGRMLVRLRGEASSLEVQDSILGDRAEGKEKQQQLLDMGEVLIGTETARSVTVRNSSSTINPVAFGWDREALESRLAPALRAALAEHGAKLSDSHLAALEDVQNTAVLGEPVAFHVQQPACRVLGLSVTAEFVVRAGTAIRTRSDGAADPAAFLSAMSQLGWWEQKPIERRPAEFVLQTSAELWRLCLCADVARSIRSLRIACRFVVCGATSSHDLVAFGPVLTNRTAVRHIALHTRSAVPIPFRAEVINLPVAGVVTCSPSAGVISASHPASVSVQICSPVPFESEASAASGGVRNDATGQLALRVFTLEPMPPLLVPIRVQCVDFVINTKLLQDIDFGAVLVRNEASRELILENTTREPLQYRLEVQDHEHADVFLPLELMSGRIEAGEAVRVPIQFNPRQNLHLQTTLRIITPTAGYFDVGLRGEGHVPSVRLSSSSVDFGVVGVGFPATREVAVESCINAIVPVECRPLHRDANSPFRVEWIGLGPGGTLAPLGHATLRFTASMRPQLSSTAERARFGVFYPAWGAPIAEIELVAQSGVLNVDFLPSTLVLPNLIPLGDTRTVSFVAKNSGQVSVRLQAAVAPGKTPAGTLVTLSPASAWQLAAGASLNLVVTVRATQAGRFEVPVLVQLLDTARPRQWILRLQGVGDEIALEAETRAALRAEVLPCVKPVELEPEPHWVRDVLTPVSHCAAPSVRHLLRRQEPSFLEDESALVRDLTVLPPPLAPGVTQAFKKWYHDRAPLRLTVADKSAQQ
jgi:hypothetical protein